MKNILLLLLFALLTLLFACDKQTVEPEIFGDIDGMVIDSETGEGVAAAKVVTSPPTSAILTNDEGEFQIQQVPTGQYAISAEKSGYGSGTVNIRVWDDRQTSAVLTLDPESDDGTAPYFRAEIIRWNQITRGDSTFAEVDYEVRNVSEATDISRYEVYFRIATSDGPFSHEISDTALAPGERTIGQFQKYIYQSTIDSIAISGTWTR